MKDQGEKRTPKKHSNSSLFSAYFVKDCARLKMPQATSSTKTKLLKDGETETNKSPANDVATSTVTRADLADAIHRKVGLPRADSAKLVEMILEEIFECIVSREDVKLSSFGAFQVRAKKERLGRNPKTGAGARISARLVVTFKPSNIMRARVSGLAYDGHDDD